MRLWITGAQGQVGWELQRSLASLGQITATARSDVDLADPAAVAAAFARIAPDVVLNAAADTAVDRAESDPDTAYALNARLPEQLAALCAAADALLVHWSTDYVFDGAASRPYREDDATAPAGVYGASKLEGEIAIRASAARHLILRTAWVYAARGGNFLKTMLRLANTRDSLRVVADQIGAPTWSRHIADATAALLLRAGAQQQIRDTLHLTAAGQTSWHGFAEAVIARGAALGLCRAVPVAPISTAEYPTPARRPAYSVLDGERLASVYGLQLPDWSVGVEACLDELSTARASLVQLALLS
jgi:dTDP-4-dehydrorhamnose reductase